MPTNAFINTGNNNFKVILLPRVARVTLQIMRRVISNSDFIKITDEKCLIQWTTDN